MPIFNMTGGASLKCETGTIIGKSIFKVHTTLNKITHYAFIRTADDGYEGFEYAAFSDGNICSNSYSGLNFSNNNISTSLKEGVFSVTLYGGNGGRSGRYYYVLIGE